MNPQPSPAGVSFATVKLDDKYTLRQGFAFMSGIQALVLAGGSGLRGSAWSPDPRRIHCCGTCNVAGAICVPKSTR